MTTPAELVALARRDIDKGRLPACQLAVARDGELVLFETLGDATAATRFCAFSAVKPVVASAVWLMIGDGLLDVSRPVGDYIPEFATHGKEVVTVEHVLLHTAGFPSAPIADTDDRATRVRRFGEWHLEWPPGSRFAYHPTQAHWVLAELIERLGGADFRDFVADRVCRPLGLPRVLGIPEDDQAGIAEMVPVGGGAPEAYGMGLRLNRPAVRAAGVPGGGGIMTAADLALFYQALLHNPGSLWKPEVLADATSTIRCTFPDPLMGVAANRSLGLVLAGDDGQHTARYAGFGQANSPSSFGHAGAYMQIGWADPATGLSFAYLTNGLEADQLRAGARGVRLAGVAAALEG
ncbi:MAG TPA: serine hydrolase domain-containing protein [Acidimicrobiales bacterium]